MASETSPEQVMSLPIGSSQNANNTSSSTQQPELEAFEEERIDIQDINYPTGIKLWLTMISLCFAYFFHGLDLTIVAVAVPTLTDQFKTVSDIGWYSAAYGMSVSAFVFFFGKVYTVFPLKSVFIFGIIVFEVGSLICTLAPTSSIFILGRTIAGVGSSAIGVGAMKIIRHCFPLSKLALAGGLVGGCQSLGLVSAPVVGGALIDAFSWRACFGINLPLGAICVALTAYGFTDPVPNPNADLTLKEKIVRVDPFGTLLIVPCITCLLMALQWGGTKYGWKDWRIIVLFVVFGVLFAVVGYIQHRQGEKATLPLRILRNRNILAAMWYTGCCNGILAMTEYYISIYFQGVRGFTARKSGLLGLPMLGGFAVSFISAAAGTTKIGYYVPFMFATSILAPIASGLLTTLDLSSSIIKPMLLLAFLGFAVGLGQQSPQLAVQSVLSASDVSLGGAVITFGAGMGSALWICASATLFNSRLGVEIGKYAEGVNVTAVEDVGLSGIRGLVGEKRLGSVLAGYDKAVVQTLYMPLALGVLTILGTGAMEWRSLKKKQT